MMEPNEPIEQATPETTVTAKKEKSYVYTARDWKEYAGESLLIIFSVLLALILTEFISNLNEEEKTRVILKNVVAELEHNKKAIQEMQQYNLKVLANIDSILVNPGLQNKLVANDEFQLKMIAPEGLLYRYLDTDAWTIAVSNNITSKINYKIVPLLTKAYMDQNKLMKVEEEVAKVIFDRNSRDLKQVHVTLILIRDLYHGWAVDRSDGLVQQIDFAIEALSKN